MQLINELTEIMDQETRIYEDILRISKNKTNIVIEGKVLELENIVKLEQAMVLQIGRLEDLREKLVDKLAEQVGIPQSEITVSALISRLHKDQADKLKNCQDKLAGVLGELKDANGLNSKLIRNSLDYINFSVNLLTTNDMGSNNYGSTGSVNDPKKRTLFDVKL